MACDPLPLRSSTGRLDSGKPHPGCVSIAQVTMSTKDVVDLSSQYCSMLPVNLAQHLGNLWHHQAQTTYLL